MFARRLRLTLRSADGFTPVPKRWLDDFFMRNFTGYSAFDETLVTGEGELEASLRVPLEQIASQFEKWLRGRRMIPNETTLVVEPASP